MRNIPLKKSLAYRFSGLVKEWNYERNDGLKPEGVTPGSHMKVWWKCSKRGHEWDARIANRTNKKNPSGCPYCSGKRAGKDNNLLVKFPKIAKEWHPIKNKKLKPEGVTLGSHKKVWWKCSKRGHEWYARIYSRTKNVNPRRCPECYKESSKR